MNHEIVADLRRLDHAGQFIRTSCLPFLYVSHLSILDCFGPSSEDLFSALFFISFTLVYFHLFHFYFFFLSFDLYFYLLFNGYDRLKHFFFQGRLATGACAHYLLNADNCIIFHLIGTCEHTS